MKAWGSPLLMFLAALGTCASVAANDGALPARGQSSATNTPAATASPPSSTAIPAAIDAARFTVFAAATVEFTQAQAQAIGRTPTAPPTAAPNPSEPPQPLVYESKVATGTEPTISANPENGDLAVISQNIPWPATCSRPSVRFSSDRGGNWGNVSYPWGSQCQDIHAVIAWGPNGRLWAADAVGIGDRQVKLSVTYSDDRGRSWAPRYVENLTPGWVGCYPAMTVGADGTVYVAYNWLPDPRGPGLAVLARPLSGEWAHVEVPVVGMDGHPAHNRIGYRIEAVPDGAVVSWYESDLAAFPDDILTDGSRANIGRAGFAVARLKWSDRVLSLADIRWAGDVRSNASSVIYDPRWQSQLALIPAGDADAASDITLLAVEDGSGRVQVRKDGAALWSAVGFNGSRVRRSSGLRRLACHESHGCPELVQPFIRRGPDLAGASPRGRRAVVRAGRHQRYRAA